jgi:hypothetical protein
MQVARLVPENMKLFIVFQVIGYDHLLHPDSNQSCLLNTDSDCITFWDQNLNNGENTQGYLRDLQLYLGH